MKKTLTIFMVIALLSAGVQAQVEPDARNWKTWFITSAKAYQLPAPPPHNDELEQVLAAQKNADSATWQQVLHWSAGAPGYRWDQMMTKLWQTDTSRYGALAQMLLATGIYDATVAAWESKYTYNRPRPFEADDRIQLYAPDPRSPSYPCEHSVAAGVAVTIIERFYPAMAESTKEKARQVMNSRVAAGVAFPSDTRAGFELGKRIATEAIERTKDFVVTTPWDKKIPDGGKVWRGKQPMLPLAGRNKTVVLKSADQFRPGPPPDFEKEMEELRTFKPTFRSLANAFRFASQSEEVLNTKIFEYNLHLNPPRAARLYAIDAVGKYDAFVSCWDAKYAYWGIRPDQYDTTYTPPLLHTPPFPGYPSGHAMIGAVSAELYSYFFPADREYFQKRAKDGAESRFHGGIHFRSDNETGLDMGRKVAAAIIAEVKTHGVDDALSAPASKLAERQVASRKD